MRQQLNFSKKEYFGNFAINFLEKELAICIWY
ncbi:hypothetical protein PRV_00710 [Mycoplasma parvum str. Indiana]|uniref:Uncharacterized protein n=1 Tax=Mycoplasma parvum str. Indiana TaxID=1403316 RepID=U5NFB8_9MOLU|nr:hypothetical protein PRV_00710 [Mycoplasma parvum str. Indiana]